jgi:hypothetical protein
MTYIPESPSSYKKDQIILNSGRILLNAKSDSVLIRASKAISLSSAGTINFDSDNSFIVNAPRIDLGLNAVEPLLKGNTTVDYIKRLIEQFSRLCEILEKLTGAPAGIPIFAVNAVASTIKTTLTTMLTQIESLKSKQNFTL